MLLIDQDLAPPGVHMVSGSSNGLMPMLKSSIKLMYKILPYVIRVRIRSIYQYIFESYEYRVKVTRTQGVSGKLPLLLQSLRGTFMNRKKILFYPDGPRDFHALYKILKFLGYRIESDPRSNCDLAIKWWLAFDGNPFAPEKPFPQIKFKGKGQNRTKLLNIRCSDISKTHVNSAFEEIFGYAISVDPRKHRGKCVMKLDWNALHKGRIIDCPVSSLDDDFVYQKLVRNETKDGFVEDIRVPIFRNKTPFVYLKYRSVKNRFIDRDHANTKATIVEVAEVLSGEELKNIHRFCARIGMDYGEIDVLRDKDDKRIYIVDANNTPSGPPTPISDDERDEAVVRLSRAFEEAFGV